MRLCESVFKYRSYELYELYYRITQITGKPVFYIVVQKYIWFKLQYLHISIRMSV